jgi:hypothetical protein
MEMEREGRQEMQLDNINAILDTFQKHNSVFIDADRSPSTKKQVDLIDIDDS